MTTAASVDEVAETLWKAERSATPCDPVRDRLPARDLTSAYAAQESNTARSLAEGRRLVGRKIGLTSPLVQRQLGVDQPDFGLLYGDMAYTEQQPLPLRRFVRPRVEAEVALVLGRDLQQEACTAADVVQAVECALPAIEVVDSRIRDWDIGIADTIADNASGGAFVLGTMPVRLDVLDLLLAGIVLTRRGREVSTGAGAACLGNPLNAAVWLAATLAGTLHPLRAGDVVLTGPLGPMVNVRGGDVFEARVSGLGSVRTIFDSKE